MKVSSSVKLLILLKLMVPVERLSGVVNTLHITTSTYFNSDVGIKEDPN